VKILKKDAVYAQSESYLLEFNEKAWKVLREILLRSGKPG